MGGGARGSDNRRACAPQLKRKKKTIYHRVLVCSKSSHFVLFPFGTRLPFMLYFTRCGEIGFLRLAFSMGSYFIENQCENEGFSEK